MKTQKPNENTSGLILEHDFKFKWNAKLNEIFLRFSYF